jgi:hypothetical protein
MSLPKLTAIVAAVGLVAAVITWTVVVKVFGVETAIWLKVLFH